MSQGKQNVSLMNIQLGFYFEKIVPQPQDFYQKIQDKIPNTFSELPLINNVPLIPGQSQLDSIPVLQMLSIDKSYELNFARKRIDLFLHTTEKNVSYEDAYSELKSKADSLSEFVSENFQIRWIGLIVNFFYDTDSGASKISKLIDPRLIDINPGPSHNAFIKRTNHIKVLGHTANNVLVVGCAKAKSPTDKEPRKGITIRQDFNTRPSKIDINSKFIFDFLDECSGLIKLNDIIDTL